MISRSALHLVFFEKLPPLSTPILIIQRQFRFVLLRGERPIRRLLCINHTDLTELFNFLKFTKNLFNISDRKIAIKY